MIAALLDGGHVVDLALVVMLAEAVALAAYHRRTGRGIAPGNLAGFLLSGTGLLLALRVVLTGGWPGWVAPCLTLALAAHLADLRQRWQR